MSARKRQGAVAQRLFRVDAEALRQVGHREEELAHRRVQRRPPRPASGSSEPGVGLPGPRRQRGQRRRGSDSPRRRTGLAAPTARALRASLVVSISAGSPAGMPSVTLRRPFSLFLIASQFDTTCVRALGVGVAEDVGVAVHQLVVDAARHVGQVEPPLLVGQAGVEDDLEQEVAQLLLQVAQAASTRRPSERGQRVEDLVALLERCGMSELWVCARSHGQRRAQRVHERDQPCHLRHRTTRRSGRAPGCRAT